MTALELIKALNVKSVSVITIGVLTLIQISPIKVNPWSWIARHIGRAINGELMAKVDQLEQDSIVNCRVRILRFGDELLLGVQHTKDHFDQTMRDIDMYERYCAAHKDFENGITDATIEQIRATYTALLQTGDFLSARHRVA